MVEPVGRWICEQCGGRFEREKSGARPIRFCDVSCYHTWRKINKIATGQFQSGSVPWNKDLKGIHLSPGTEWGAGCVSLKKVPVGTETIRRRRRELHQRAFIKVAEPNHWRARAIVVWERENGPLPKGYIVHHRDRNPLNDTIGNLQAMTRRDHALEHIEELRKPKDDLFLEAANG